MDHGNNQTRSAIPQAAWCQLNRGRIRRLLGYLKRFVWRNEYGDGNHRVQIVAPSGEVLLNSSQSRGTIEFNDYGWIPKGSVIKHWGNHVDWTYFDEWLAYEPEAVSISLDDVTRIL